MKVDARMAHEIAMLIQKEGSLLDEHAWDDWLQLYDPECEYWIPMWDDDARLTVDPEREMSLIYYASRAGLEDRVFRIKTNMSAASSPLFRTTHLRAAPLCEVVEDGVVARFPWTTHAFRLGRTQTYFGRRTLWLRDDGERLRIVKSHAVVCNDLIDEVLDIYHV